MLQEVEAPGPQPRPASPGTYPGGAAGRAGPGQVLPAPPLPPPASSCSQQRPAGSASMDAVMAGGGGWRCNVLVPLARSMDAVAICTCSLLTAGLPHRHPLTPSLLPRPAARREARGGVDGRALCGPGRAGAASSRQPPPGPGLPRVSPGPSSVLQLSCTYLAPRRMKGLLRPERRVKPWGFLTSTSYAMGPGGKATCTIPHPLDFDFF